MVEMECSVCGSNVRSAAPERAEYGGNTHLFDRKNCWRAFDENPEEYAD